MTVYLVGAGPGDPSLLTVKGAEVLRRADVVVYDRLSVASLVDLAPPDAERISVGKTPGHPSAPQEEINALLISHGRAGKEHGCDRAFHPGAVRWDDVAHGVEQRPRSRNGPAAGAGSPRSRR